ncbi:DinB family protein [Pedobacter arcticus]|uniref:DinB family protein n=1 Tax=Pedobacter arcticus TaxID=752140 RepID=UPI0002FFD680|nr:DinB family protein [Pedobacter arcticus]
MTVQVFSFIVQSRQAFIHLLDSLTVEELNEIPAGFNNNIIWNFGHIVVSTQTLCYVRTGILEDAVAVKYNEEYKKDTKPTRFIHTEEIAELKALALSTIQNIKEDYQKGVFGPIQPFATSTYKAEMNSFEEILITTVGHDNIHFGYALAQRKLVKK